MRRRVYVASCRNLPDWEQDDAAFLDALNEEVDVTVLPWDQPGVDFSTFEAVLLQCLHRITSFFEGKSIFELF